MTREVTLAATQFACGWDIEGNLATAERLVRAAAGRGAQIVLLQELFATPYFPITQDSRHFDLAGPAEGHPVVARFSRLAGELGVVLPVSFFERAGQAFFNSVAVIDADGAILGVYRKSHIPDSGGYQEKYYFSPGDTGFRVWDTALARIGVGICWDQWFPECARAMALQGAEVLLYPTAIGSDPPVPEDDSRDRWQAVQRDRQFDAGGGVQQDRAGGGAGRRTEHPLLRLVVHRRRDRRAPRGGLARSRRGRHGDGRPRLGPLPARGLVVLPRPAAGAVRLLADAGRSIGARRRRRSASSGPRRLSLRLSPLLAAASCAATART
jgi:N-carbamoylputrescine amidase